MPSDHDALKQQMVAAANRVADSGILTKSFHGNISLLVPGTQTFLLTAVSNLREITAEGIAHFDMDGKLLGGSVAPVSAEIVGMHAIVYRKRPGSGAVLHTHSPFATAFAVASRAVPVSYEPLVRFGFNDGVPVAGYGPRGSQESVENISKVLDAPGTGRGLLLENHGVLTFGEVIAEAIQANMVIEESAEIIMNADLLGGAKEIPANKRGAAQARMAQFAAEGVRKT
jgi:L-ribulose-5-phosphate 4-epimerase